ncbi:MAG: adenylate kinase [Actinobacteria bacterium]|nr:adenylate kinase [Actinomycetota bacterium]MCL5446584.1 adenylate kinase [Actinomycetota bacterium]
MRLVVLGKQGSGKGTQCVLLSRYFAVPHISTGDMLRAAVKASTPVGIKVRETLEGGGLISDDIVTDVVASRLSEDDVRSQGFILDGFPRTVAQAEMLEEMLRPMELDRAIELDVPTEQTVRRLAARRVCSDCGAIYSTHKPPKFNWTCDVCGGEVVQRKDDKEEFIRRRLGLYEKETLPVAQWYEARSYLLRVNGAGTPEAVLKRIQKALFRR